MLRLVSATTIPRTHLNADLQRPTDCQPLASLVLLGRRTVRPARSAPPPIRTYNRIVVATCEQFGILKTDDSSRVLSSSRWPAQASPFLSAGSPDYWPHSCRCLWSPAAMQRKEPGVLRHGFMLPTVGDHEPLPGISCGHAHTVGHHDVVTTPRWTSGSRHLRYSTNMAVRGTLLLGNAWSSLRGRILLLDLLPCPWRALSDTSIWIRPDSKTG